MPEIKPNYGISRIDQPEKKNHGFYVRITNKGKTSQKFFPDKSCGSKSKAQKMAKSYRDKIFNKLPKARKEAAASRRKRIKQSGVTGVTHVVSKSAAGKLYAYWQAAWTEGKTRKTAKFSVARNGDKKALDLAIKAKRKADRNSQQALDQLLCPSLSDSVESRDAVKPDDLDKVLLRASSLSRSYNIGVSRLSVLRELNLNIKRQEKLFLRGASGAGKSTLLYTLAGLERPDSGSVEIDGKSLYALSHTEQTKFRNTKIGYVFQNYFLLPDLNAVENVVIPSLISGSKDNKERAIEILTKVGLGNRLRHRPSELSGGEQQRVAIARALINDPEIVFADEPTGNLDSSTGGELMETLMKLVDENKKTLIVVTHDAKLAELGDRELLLADGRIMD